MILDVIIRKIIILNTVAQTNSRNVNKNYEILKKPFVRLFNWVGIFWALFFVPIPQFCFVLFCFICIYISFSFVECSQFHVDQIGRRINWASSGTTDGRSAASDQCPRPDAAIDVSRDANIVARTQATLLRSVTCAAILN